MTNTRPRGAVPAYAAANVCVYRRAAFRGRLNLRCGRRVSGRYVMVRLRQAKKQYLTLCEVDVYATAGKFGAHAEYSFFVINTVLVVFEKHIALDSV